MPRPLTFRRGLGTGPTGIFGLMPFPDPSLAQVWHDDFHEYVAADWVLGGTGTPGRTVLDNSDGGFLRLSSSANAGDSSTALWAGSAGAARRVFTVSAGKRLGFKARVRINDNNAALIMGLADAITPAAGWAAVNDFAIVLAAAGISGRVTKASSTTSVPLVGPAVPFANNTFYEVALVFNGTDTLSTYVNRNLVGQLKSSAILSTFAPTAAMGVGIGFINASAVARNVDIDYITVVKER